ncbi:MAG: polynucleotide adenylyltransferase PcnB [Treponema sp.]|nr:polynucleotide adenylyltransferase PcnB [Treponema sp.]
MLIRYGTDGKGKPVQKAVIYTKSEHKISLANIDPDALFVVSRLKETGFDAYIVGGAVRDLIIGKKPKDFDIVTDATPSRIKRIFRNSRIIGKRFRLVHVFFGDKIFEVSTFRSTVDGSVGNSFGTMDEDVMRRDFSLNALYYCPDKEQVIDYVDGVNDIRKGIIKPVIPLDRIFTEDPVRMLRAVKYSSTTGCKMPRALKKKIRESSSLLTPVSPSRLTEEMLKILNSGHAQKIVEAALETDLYACLQPSATNLMIESRSFEKKYMTSLRELDEAVFKDPSLRLGEKLYYILRDFLSEATDWEKEVKDAGSPSELFKLAWSRSRNFVLPMNPQRTELDYAVVKMLKSFGVPFKENRKRRQRRDERKEEKKS